MKTKLLFALAWAILSGFAISAYAQIGKSGKPALTHNTNDFYRIPFPWLITGNSGTNPNKNFIGTRDAQPLIFKVNNQKAGYLDYSDLSENTAFGYQTLNSNNVVSEAGYGIFLSAFGYRALYSNTTGFGNTAHGTRALHFNTTGDINTGIGGEALFSNTAGAFNTAIGYNALYANVTGWFNTATGDYALAGNTTGSFNIATGTPFTLAFNTEGSENIATGAFSMNNNTTGNANTAYGSYSLATNATGNNNTALGYGADIAADNLNNATAIGNGALVDASNKVRIGNTDVTSIGGQVGWTSFSDERIKDNVKENVPGLEFIKALRPVTYHFNMAKENALLGIKDITTPQLKGIKLPNGKEMKMPARKDVSNLQTKNIADENKALEKIQFTGFLAQDVDKAAKKIGYDFSGIDRSGELMGLRYSDFVVPLVKAVQELSKMNEEKDKKIDGLQKQIDELKIMISSNNSTIKTGVTLNDASLEQNVPNPFGKTTSIGYSLPQKFTHAQIVIADKNGKTVKQLNISGSGKGLVNVDIAELTAGTYHYSLIVDGKVINSKQMLLVK